MKKLICAGLACAALSLGAANAGVAEAVSDESRLDEHTVRDAARKPEAVLSFAGIKSGDKVADLAAGSGYYTALLSRVVGEDGKVYAVDPTRIFDAFPNAAKTFPKYIENDPRENVEYSVQKFDELAFDESLDAVVMGLYYHDTVWTEVDRAAMNKAIYDSLKSGGVYLITDHNAASDADESVTKELHRMYPGAVKPEVLAAGFEFADKLDVLANADDPLTDSVFTDERRGKTDRFVYLFRKP